MKPASQHLLSRIALALVTLLGGAPASVVCAQGDLGQTGGRSPQFGNDGVGGIEKTGAPAGGPSTKTTPGGKGGASGIPTADPETEVGPWFEVGPGTASDSVEPTLTGTGTGVPGTVVTLSLRQAKPGAAAALIVGLSAVNVPFKGGTLVPAPMLILPGLPVDAQGALDLPALLPAALPSGLAIYTQMWMPDATAAHGYVSTNGLELLVP